MSKPDAKKEDKKQAAAFRKAARELGADASEEEFQAALRKLAKAKPSSEKDKLRRMQSGRDKQKNRSKSES